VTPRLELTDASKSFGDLHALSPVTMSVDDGEIVTLLGPSGCGKTTLLRMVAGLEAPTGGTIRVEGGSPADARRRKRIGFVPQSPALLPWRSVEQNARLLLDINRGAGDRTGGGRSTRDTRATAVRDMLDEVGLSDFLDAYPHELSGGMQQRVGLVRAFALGAPILLMDEPFAALDELTREEMRHLLVRLCEPLGTTVLFVTHSIAEAAFLSDRVAVMSARPGTITATVDVSFARPRGAELEDTDEFFHLTTLLRDELRSGLRTDRTDDR
jgi:NitT/TauT family transport system ATP-binding protein